MTCRALLVFIVSSVFAMAAVAADSIEQIRFSKVNSQAELTIDMPHRVEVDMVAGPRSLMISVPNMQLNEKWQTTMDVTSFGTVVHSVKGEQRDGDVRFTLKTKAAFVYQQRWVKNQFKILLQADSSDLAKKYVGKPISLTFQNIGVRSVLQIIAQFTGLNIVTSDAVQGNITLNLKDVPWDQALEIILQSKGLAMRQSGNVIYIAPQTQIAQHEKMALEAQAQARQLEPLTISYLRVNYAKAGELAKLLQDKDNTLLSKRGKVSYDTRTNTLLIKDTPDQLGEIKDMLQRLDIPVQQVLIEARIVEVEKGALDEFGVTQRTDSSGNAIDSFSVGNQTASHSGNAVGFSGAINNPLVKGTAAGVLGLAFNKLPGGFMLDLELQALESEGEAKVISSPKLVVSNKQEAYIEQGSEVPYLAATSSGATQVEFKKAVLSLRVTPQISPNKKVLLDLQVNKDKISNLSVKAGDTPVIDTREVKTQVMVNNGQTLVLGGIYEKTNENTVRRIPFFGNLPVIGWLFKNKYENQEESEMLIFITPTIIEADKPDAGVKPVMKEQFEALK